MVLPAICEMVSQCSMLILKVSSITGSFPRPLSRDEEEEYLRRTREGDLEARNKLVEHNLRLVAHIVKKYYASREDHDDLISIGTLGLIKAVCSYSGDKGTRLATYAARCIENEILMYFRSLKKQAVEVSLSEPIDSDKDGSALSLMDIISSDQDMEADFELSDSAEHLYKYIFTHLSEREREIIIMRYGLYGRTPLTQKEIAAQKGISRSYV
ncbi:MAG: RNA polymerase sporulation sigma factor SigK [Clostridia bacterium]|nr:RNA polymerase sporulation sigma factor SigK [Clostridia bacterium]